MSCFQIRVVEVPDCMAKIQIVCYLIRLVSLGSVISPKNELYNELS